MAAPRTLAESLPALGAMEQGLFGMLLLAPVELVALGRPSAELWWVALTLLATVGLTLGTTIAAIESFIHARNYRGWKCAALRAAPSILVTIPVSATSFEGAFASSLPAATLAPFWVPLIAWTGLTACFRSAALYLEHARGRSHVHLAVVSVAVAAALETLNRSFKVSEHDSLHTMLIICAYLAATLAFHLVRYASGTAVVVVPILGTVVSLTIGLGFALSSTETRQQIAARGMHTRLLLGAIRNALDFDGDGYSASFGGADCNDFDPTQSPAAREIPGNDIDENCDGVVDRRLAPTSKGSPAVRPHRLPAPRTRRDYAGHNLLLITVDALRADVLRVHAGDSESYPNLTALLAASRQFDHAFAPASGTDISISTLLTGQINPFSHVPATLAESLRQNGFVTHAVIPREVLRYAGKTLLTRGLDSFDLLVNDKTKRNRGSHSTSEETTRLGLRFLDRPQRRRGAPFFLWLHYFDVHEHHQIDADDPHLLAVAQATDLDDRTQRYRATVSLVDRAVGTLVDALQQRQLWDQTIVVFASDHGESLHEDPRLPENHGRVLYNALVHVPLGIRLPGIQPANIPIAVSLLDVTPTVRDLLALPPNHAEDGQSLHEYLEPEPATTFGGAPRIITLYESDQRGLIIWPYKVLRRPREGVIELYDLSSDFDERRNLASTAPSSLARMLLALDAAPELNLDRTRAGRRRREQLAKAPPPEGE
ncbi:MAG: sulfatase [Nannocystaceae bacterium]